MTTTVVRLGLAAVLSVGLSGCAFNLACDLFGSFFQRQMPGTDVCGTFNGECCGDQDDDGFPDECSGFLGFPPCGRFDTDECFCTTGIGFGLDDPQGQTLVPAPAAYAFPPGADFAVRLPYAGMESAHRVFFDTVAQDLQTRQAVITYPDAFGFGGFLALGPPETVIGALGVDLNLDFTPDLSLPLKALTADTAYVDGDASGAYNAADPLLTHATGSHVFTLTAPRGGDGLARTKVGRIPLRLAVGLYAGILRNPTVPGFYAVDATFTSVDPESGDADDGVGTPPTSFAAPTAAFTIFQPPFEPLSPFLCYATKPTKGTLCAGTAAANAGGACATDADCGGTPLACAKSPLAKGRTAGLQEEVTPTALPYAVGKPATLCAPAELNGQGRPADELVHLRGYALKPAKGVVEPVGPKLLPVTNALGTVVIDVQKTDRLLLTSATALDAPASAIGGTDIEDLQCHKVKLVKKRCAENPERKCKKSADCGVDGPCLQGVPKGLTVQVGTAFTGFTARVLAVGKPTRFCYPAEVDDGGDIDNPSETLLCYQAKPAKGTAKHEKILGRLHTTNALARERLDTAKESEVCVPSFAGGIL